jgi:DNA-binding XRE family transcriptional regulator
MNFDQALATAVQHAPKPGLAIDVLAVMHKARYPMADILAKVPGDSLAARARAIGVARQTMYVWAQERFRPSREQAAIIAELTGVPVEQIGEYQEGKYDGVGSVGKPPRKKAVRVAKDGEGVPRRAKRARAERGGVGAKPGVGGSPRKVRKRTGKRPVGGKGD